VNDKCYGLNLSYWQIEALLIDLQTIAPNDDYENEENQI
jgi:hypothetical protein